MTAVGRIQEVLESGVLLEDLVVVPTRGASEEEIAEEERELGIQLSSEYRRLLRRWNGLNLDVLRLYGCCATEEGIAPLRARQAVISVPEISGVAIGSDPSGFIYIESQDGQILCLDTDGGGIERVAAGFDDFILRLVFGSDADRFADAEWKEELAEAGIL